MHGPISTRCGYWLQPELARLHRQLSLAPRLMCLTVPLLAYGDEFCASEILTTRFLQGG